MPSLDSSSQEEECILASTKNCDCTKTEKEDDFLSVSSNETTQVLRCSKWSEVLSTPCDSAIFTPTAEMSSSKLNLHGIGLKMSIDRALILSRTGKSCATLLIDIAMLHEELALSILKICPSTLESASSGTPLQAFGSDVNNCIFSFTKRAQRLGVRMKNDIAQPWINYLDNLEEKLSKIYTEYTTFREKCAQSRKDALKMRGNYVAAVKSAESSIKVLRKCKITQQPKPSNASSDATQNNSLKQSELCDSHSFTMSSEENDEHIRWKNTLRDFGNTHGLTKNVESVIRDLQAVQTAEGQYCASVQLENSTVTATQEIERKALDTVQNLEEERLLFLLQSFHRFHMIGKEAMEGMSLDLSVEPLDLSDDSNHKELPVQLSGPSLFMTPRRRTQSEDGPAINETRLLNLPDDVAMQRDNMKSQIGRQSARLKCLKLVSSFNEGMASAFEAFAVGLQNCLDKEDYETIMESKNPTSVSVNLNSNEGKKILTEWNNVVCFLKTYANNVSFLSKQIKMGNHELCKILITAEKELKLLFENEEVRWRNLCDAAKTETKALSKQKQLIADSQRAKMRLTLVDEDSSTDDNTSHPLDDSKTLVTNFMGQSNKMAPSMNKAMGKMFSILPGGGEDVMNKVLKPEQRLAILRKNLDEAKLKEAKATDSFEITSKLKIQSIESYKTQSETAYIKFKKDEFYEWNEIQKSLENSVKAMRAFRNSQQNCVTLSNESQMAVERNVIADDLCKWTTDAEFKLVNYRNHCAAEMIERENRSEHGFSLALLLEDSRVIKELVESVVNGSLEQSIDVVESVGNVTALSDVPVDSIINEMDPIFSKELKNVTMESYYNHAWSDEVPLYGPWLERKGSFDVVVSNWDHSNDGFQHPWSSEIFHQRRVIRFKFERKTHLYIGPKVAGVTQTQYCLRDGNDRCVVMMTVEMDGIPYSDSFVVEVRWAARRVGELNIVIDAGVYVRFTKSSMFAKQIKSGTLLETKPIHLDLFEVIKVATTVGQNNTGVIDVEPEKTADFEVESQIANDHLRSYDLIMQMKGIIQNIACSSILPFSRDKQMLYCSAFCIFLFLLASSMFSNSLENDEIGKAVEHLTNKVDQMSNDLEIIKAMLHKIHDVMNEKAAHSAEHKLFNVANEI